jgi:hypothetical protein
VKNILEKEYFCHKFSILGLEIATIAPQYERVLEIFYFHILHIAKYDKKYIHVSDPSIASTNTMLAV